MNEAVLELLEKSAQSIGAAELPLKDGYVDFAASRSYYAMFYAVEELLLKSGFDLFKTLCGYFCLWQGVRENRVNRRQISSFHTECF